MSDLLHSSRQHFWRWRQHAHLCEPKGIVNPLLYISDSCRVGSRRLSSARMAHLWNQLQVDLATLRVQSGENPFLVARDLIAERLTPPQASNRQRVLGTLCLVFFVTLFFLSSYVVYVMAVTNRLRLPGRTPIGMLRFETINTHSVCALVFSIWSLVGLLLQSCIGNKTLAPYSSPILGASEFVIMAKLLTMLVSSWCFIWASICHCISTAWMPGVLSNTARKNARPAQLPRYLRWLSHLAFITPLSLFAVLFIWSIAKFTRTARYMSLDIGQLLTQLTEAAAGYDSQHYKPADLWENLSPVLQRIPGYRARLNHFYRLILMTYLVFEASAAVIYAPLLYICLRDLHTQTAAVTTLETSISDQDEQLRRVIKRLKLTRRTLVYRALAVYLFSVSCIPGMCWQMGQDVWAIWDKSDTWVLFSTLIECGIVCGVNINLVILTVYCRELLRAHRKENEMVEELEEVDVSSFSGCGKMPRPVIADPLGKICEHV